MKQDYEKLSDKEKSTVLAQFKKQLPDIKTMSLWEKIQSLRKKK